MADYMIKQLHKKEAATWMEPGLRWNSIANIGSACFDSSNYSTGRYSVHTVAAI